MTVASRTSADPLGPDSLTWKYFGDLRTGMMGVWIGAIQNMYPELGAGVEEHSILLREPLQRVARSVYPIMGVVYDGDRAAQTGQQIKGYHRTIKGVDAEGRRYHALNPDTFYWAHATFFHACHQGRRILLRRLDRGRKTPALRGARALVPDVWDEHATGAQVVGRLSGLLGPGVPRQARDQSGDRGHPPDADSQTEVCTHANADLGSAVQAANSRSALDRGRPVRPGRAGEGGNALDTG